jgi:transposase-like protein
VENLMADGTGFKRQPGQRGEVRMVLGLQENGDFEPLGVWAGTGWKEIAADLRVRLQGKPRPRLLVSDGEHQLETWLSELTKRTQRCQWHFVRQSTLTAWKADMPKREREALKSQLAQLVAIELPASDVEPVQATDRQTVATRLREARLALQQLAVDLDERGYPRAATYLTRAGKQLFAHLDQWLECGIIGPRTTSLIESVIRELTRRLKKIGWNWSDAGATRMGRIVIIRHYDEQAWEEYWQERLQLKNRCQMRILWCVRAA